MSSIQITADSTCDLSQALVQKYDIGIMPLYIIKDGEAFKDGLEITPKDIFAHMEAGGSPCSTSAVNVADYMAFFSERKKTHDAVIHFTISASISSSYQNAYTAAQEVGGVFVVDSQSLSTGIGHLVLSAAELAQEGLDVKEIFDRIEQLKKKLNVSFVLDTLEYMKRGGRCSSIVAVSASILKIKPCIEVHDGTMGVGRKYRGAKEKYLTQYVRDKLSNPNHVDAKRIFITDSHASDETFSIVERAVKELIPFEEIIHTRAGCTVSSHCGPECIGILFYNK